MTHFVHRNWKRFCGLAIIILVSGLAASWIVGGRLCAPCNHTVALPKDLPVEQVTFNSASGTTIHGWLVEPATNHGVVILQHGMSADKSTLVERAKFLSQAGYAVLLFDFQAHGESVGEQITFGYLESRDSQAAVNFAKKRFPGKPIGVIGVSLGAAAAALAVPPLDVQAMVLEMMYPTVVDATKDRIEMRLGKPGRLLSPLLTAQFKLRAGFGPDDLRPIVCVETITEPKLFLAGTADRDTKFDEAKEIFARAASPKQFVPFEGAKHEDLLAFAPERYKQLILDFLDANLK
jgi:pimeloyl-ACP methyl ester carboxylesterase